MKGRLQGRFCMKGQPIISVHPTVCKSSRLTPLLFLPYTAMPARASRKPGNLHKLFGSAGSPLAFTDRRLKAYAKEVGLKIPDFNQCLDSGKYFKKVDVETAIAAFLGARGTPAFFLNGQLLVGAQPFEVFRNAIEDELRKSSSKKKGR